MPNANINNAEIYYEEHGSGSEVMLFAHGLLMSGEMFKAQVEHFSDRYRCITFDFRGQGKSEVTETGYDMDTLTDDVVALLNRLGIPKCHFAGLSMGGFVGMRLAIRYPELVQSLILLDTSAEPEDSVAEYRRLNMIARWFGLGVIANKVMPIMFGQKFLNDPERAEERDRWKRFIISNHKIGITRAVTGVIDRDGIEGQIDQISTPTLILVGDQDVATEPVKSERMHEAIPNSELLIVPGAGHSSTIEEPEAINNAIEAFLEANKF